ncbi:hypothetical protein YC2023_081189 [Brassica napus]
MEDLSKARLTCKTWFKSLVEASFILRHLKVSNERFLRVEHEVSSINPIDSSVKSAPLLLGKLSNIDEMKMVLDN